MANTTKQATPKQPASPASSLPEGFEERSSDIVGSWSGDGSIRFVPTHCTVADGKKFDPSKPSVLIFGKLTAPAELRSKQRDEDDSDPEPFQGKPGELVGVWYKPGMRDIAHLCGEEVYLAREPSRDKDTGKGNVMKAYKVASKRDSNRLIPIQSDRREKSRGVATPFDPPGYNGSVNGGTVPIRDGEGRF